MDIKLCRLLILFAFGLCGGFLPKEEAPDKNIHLPKDGEQLISWYDVTGKETGNKYRVALFYSKIDDRFRAEVFIGSKHLTNLYNRFTDFSPTDPFTIDTATDENGKEVIVLSQKGGEVHLTPAAEGVNTGTLYNAMEKVVRESFKKSENYEVSLGGPAGLLKKTYVGCVSLKRMHPCLPQRYLVTLEGTVTPLTLERVVNAYRQEHVQASTEKKRETIVKSLIQVDNLWKTDIISGLDDIPGYKKRPLDTDLENTVQKPWTQTDKGGTLYWICYTYTKVGGTVCRYKVRFYEGKRLGNPVEKLQLGSGIGDADYLE